MLSFRERYKIKESTQGSGFGEGLAQLMLAFALISFISLFVAAGARAASYSGSLAGSAAASQVRQSEQARQAAAAAPATNVQRPEKPAQKPLSVTFPKDAQWRVRILDAAVVQGPSVLLGEIAVPAGPMPNGLWEQLKNHELWLSPEEEGRPVNLTRPKLQQAMVAGMGRSFAVLCLYPPSITLQRGGKLYDGPSVQELTVKTLAPYLSNLPGEASFSDFRLPANIFVSSATQTFELEDPLKVAPGRLSLRFAIREVDGSVVRRITGNVFVDCWAPVACVTAPVNKGEVLGPELITYKSKNLAYLRDEPWDGRGGPWQVIRPIGLDQPILQSDLTYVPTVKKGKVIKLVFESGTVRLVATVEAMADGVSGETIPVKNLQSKRQVYAVVQDENTVLARSNAVRISLVPQTGQSSAAN